MLTLSGTIVTVHEFSSKKTGKDFMRIGVCGGGEFNQFNCEKDGTVYEIGDEIRVNVRVNQSGQIWKLGE